MIIKRIGLLFTIFVVALGSAQAPKRVFTIEDLYRVKAVSDLSRSPDGKKALFLVAASALPRAKRVTHVWTMDIDGSNARELTHGEKGENSPQFSPDGKWLSFINAADSSLNLMSTDGGEPRKLANLSTGIADPLWSPDGKLIAFSSDVYPECGGDDACNKKIAERWESGPLKAHIADNLLYRHWTAWKDGTRTHTFVVNASTGETRDVTPGNYDAPTFQLGGPLQYAFSPDSAELVYVSNHDPVPAISTNNDLWLLSLNDPQAQPRNITASNPAYDGSPKYSPDGKYIAFRMQKQPGYESDLFRLALYERATNKTTILTESFKNWVDDFRWSPDSRTIFFSAPVEGQNPIYRLDVASGKISKEFASGSIDEYDFSTDQKYLYMIIR